MLDITVTTICTLILASANSATAKPVEDFDQALGKCAENFQSAFHKISKLVESSDLRMLEKRQTIKSLANLAHEFKVVRRNPIQVSEIPRPLLLKKCLTLVSSLDEVQLKIQGKENDIVGKESSTDENEDINVSLRKQFIASYNHLKVKMKQLIDLVTKCNKYLPKTEVEKQMGFEHFLNAKLNSWEKYYNNSSKQNPSREDMENLIRANNRMKVLTWKINKELLHLLKAITNKRYEIAKTKGFLNLPSLEAKHSQIMTELLVKVKRRLDKYHYGLSKISHVLSKHSPRTFRRNLYITMTKVKISDMYHQVENLRDIFEKCRADQSAMYADCKSLDSDTLHLLSRMFLLYREVKEHFKA